MYRMQIEALETDPPDNVDSMKLNILKKKYQQTADRYDAEQLEIHLPIAILLVSLCGLMKEIYFWYAGAWR